MDIEGNGGHPLNLIKRQKAKTKTKAFQKKRQDKGKIRQKITKKDKDR